MPSRPLALARRAFARRRAKMASLTRRLRERSVSLGILPLGKLAVVTGPAAAVVLGSHGRSSGTVSRQTGPEVSSLGGTGGKVIFSPLV